MARGAGLLLLALGAALAACTKLPAQPELGARSKPIIETDGLRFRDLDGNGELTPYEDWRLSPETRAADLAARMTDAEKAGTLLHGNIPGLGQDYGNPTGYDLDALGQVLADRHITSFITRLAIEPSGVAGNNNSAQELAEATRLGIPLTISSDPRHHFQYVLGASASANGTTQWPELLGFAALGDADLIRRFGLIARKEYRALGIHMALSPQLDLATEPRWGRISGTFGSDAELVSRLGGAYVAAFQGGAAGLRPDGVIAVAKHWVGYGAQPEGFDAHNYYGRFARPGKYFPSHVEAFKGALDSRVAGIMPAYPILEDVELDGEPLEPVGPGFNRQLLTGLLREELGFAGFILSDWAITRDCTPGCREPTAAAPQAPPDIATSWGVEDLTVRQRYAKGIQAGIDQFGGVDDVAPLLEAIEAGEISPVRIDEAVRRILVPKFQLGLFENPYVDAAEAPDLVRRPEDEALAFRTQAESQVLLQGKNGLLPLAPGRRKVWLFGVDHAAAEAEGLEVVDDPAEADFAIIRTEAPSEMLHPHHFFGSRYKEGRLDFRNGDPAFEALKRASATVPVIFSIFLDRPAVLANVQDKANVILANFGASDEAVLAVVLGRYEPRGRLPFALPRSMTEVEAQDPAAPDDYEDPLYPRGWPAAE
ncbi:MAG TPA: glycoside hydrolase family 3 N-terminal domain-containing protein [Sphingomonadaceae bacterium]|nr:glycoside hydrolase family 3 N-terminal domain-containing protein [Sphingomonadaceae bacterium]